MPPLPRETPHDFLVTEQFLATPFASGAYARNEDPDKDEVSQLICAGEKVRADPEAWKGHQWGGQQIIDFSHADSTYYVAAQVFRESTQPANAVAGD